MKNTRKFIIAILAIAAIMTTALLPAMAETVTPSTNNALTVTGRGPGGPGGQQGQGGRGGQMPGNNRQGGKNGQQMPGNNPQMPQNDQAPDAQQNDDQQARDNNCQQPRNGGRMGKGFKGGRGQRDMLNLDALVKDGALSQETKDAIDKYMTEKKQTQKEDRMKSLLDELKDAGVITDEEYEAIEAAKPAAPAAAPADGEAPADASEMPEVPADGEAPADAPEAPEAPETEDVPAEQADTQE